jgi:hypothetical protein
MTTSDKEYIERYRYRRKGISALFTDEPDKNEICAYDYFDLEFWMSTKDHFIGFHAAENILVWVESAQVCNLLAFIEKPEIILPALENCLYKNHHYLHDSSTLRKGKDYWIEKKEDHDEPRTHHARSEY